jgi:hypothetical protein
MLTLHADIFCFCKRSIVPFETALYSSNAVQYIGELSTINRANPGLQRFLKRFLMLTRAVPIE